MMPSASVLALGHWKPSAYNETKALGTTFPVLLYSHRHVNNCRVIRARDNAYFACASGFN